MTSVLTKKGNLDTEPDTHEERQGEQCPHQLPNTSGNHSRLEETTQSLVTECFGCPRLLSL